MEGLITLEPDHRAVELPLALRVLETLAVPRRAAMEDLVAVGLMQVRRPPA